MIRHSCDTEYNVLQLPEGTALGVISTACSFYSEAHFIISWRKPSSQPVSTASSPSRSPSPLLCLWPIFFLSPECKLIVCMSHGAALLPEKKDKPVKSNPPAVKAFRPENCHKLNCRIEWTTEHYNYWAACCSFNHTIAAVSFCSHAISCTRPKMTRRQEKIAQRLERDALRCLGRLRMQEWWRLSRAEIDFLAISSPPSHCSWVRAARQLSVPATSDRCLLSLRPGWSTICITFSPAESLIRVKMDDWEDTKSFNLSYYWTYQT